MRRLCALAVCITACTSEPPGFECTAAEQCTGGEAGACEITGYCSFASASCANGRRYGNYAAPHLRNQCVGDSSSGRFGETAAGSDHTCALEEGGDVWCWGRNDRGQLGDGTRSSIAMPVHVVGLLGVTVVAAGELHSCAISAGEVWCWGSNERGQLGDATNVDSPVPVRASSLDDAVALGLGEYHSCAQTGGGDVWCWGANTEGQLGDGTTTDRNVPAPVSGVAEAKQLAVDGHHSCAQSRDGSVRCWGSNEFGQLGLGSDAERYTTPQPIGWLTRARSIAAGGDHLCGLGIDRAVRCAGFNDHGQLGDGTRKDRRLPVTVAGLRGVDHIVAGEWFTCASQRGGHELRCWGRNEQGELGREGDDTEPRPGPPTQVGGRILHIAAGERHACAQTADGCLWCWGSNEYGQLARGDGDDDTAEPRPTRLSCW